MVQLTNKIPATDGTIEQLDKLLAIRAKDGQRIMSHMELTAALINLELLRELKKNG